MMKKLGIILLTITFLLSTLSLLPVKEGLCNRPEERLLMAAEPWDWWYHSGKGGSGSQGGDNQGIADSTNQFVINRSFSNSTETNSYQRECSMREKPLNWRLRLLLFWQMFFHR